MLPNADILFMHIVMKLDCIPVSSHSKRSFLNFKYELVEFVFGSSVDYGNPIFVQARMLYFKFFIMDFPVLRYEGRNVTELMQVVNFTGLIQICH